MNNLINNQIDAEEDQDLIFLGSVQEKTQGFDFEGKFEPKDFDKYKEEEVDIMP